MITAKEAWKTKETFVNMIRSGKPAKHVWEIMGYCRENRAYELRSTDDVSIYKYLPGTKIVSIAQDY